MSARNSTAHPYRAARAAVKLRAQRRSETDGGGEDESIVSDERSQLHAIARAGRGAQFGQLPRRASRLQPAADHAERTERGEAGSDEERGFARLARPAAIG